MRPNGWKVKGFDSETYLGVISRRIRMVGWMKWCEMVDGIISYNLCSDVFYDVVRCTYQNTLELWIC